MSLLCQGKKSREHARWPCFQYFGFVLRPKADALGEPCTTSVSSNEHRFKWNMLSLGALLLWHCLGTGSPERHQKLVVKMTKVLCHEVTGLFRLFHQRKIAFLHLWTQYFGVALLQQLTEYSNAAINGEFFFYKYIIAYIIQYKCLKSNQTLSIFL